MKQWPVTVALTDEEADALAAHAEAEFDGDRDAAARALIGAWLAEHGDRSNRFRR